MIRVNFRTPALLVGVLSTAPLSAQDAGDPLTPLEVVRVERALERRLACLGCHRIAGRGGRIGPSLDGLSERADLAYALAMIRDPSSTVPGTIMPRQHLPDRDAERLARYLLSLERRPDDTPSTPPEAPAALPPGRETDGEALYARHCAACHGEEGAGDGWNAANLPVTPTRHADPTAMSQRPDDTLYDGIHAGGFVLDKSALMPAFGSLLSPEQIRAVVGHIRTLCACEQPAWAAR